MTWSLGGSIHLRLRNCTNSTDRFLESHRGNFIFPIQYANPQCLASTFLPRTEVKIRKQDFYDTIYASSASPRRSDKYPWFAKFLGLDLCVFGTVQHDLHKKRRAALLPYFSMGSVRKLQPVIQERVIVLLDRLKGFKDTGEVLNASCMFAAFTNGQ